MYQELDKHNCKKHTGYTINQLLGLTGIFGIHPKFNSSQSKRCVLIQTYNRVEIEINETKDLEVLLVEIDLENKTISNKLIKKRSKRENIAIDRLSSQISYAIDYNFIQIFLLAYGTDDREHYIGYKYWYKFGFLMPNKVQKKFNHILLKYLIDNDIQNDNITSDTTLYDLLKFREGKEIWEKIAFDWTGIFYIDKEHTSTSIFNERLLELNRHPIKL